MTCPICRGLYGYPITCRVHSDVTVAGVRLVSLNYVCSMCGTKAIGLPGHSVSSMTDYELEALKRDDRSDTVVT